MSVKQERHDEAEIRELAAKMLEENRARMSNSARAPVAGVQGMSIFSYLNSSKNKTMTAPVTANNAAETTKNMDEASIRGNFGWITIAKVHIPYILRGSEQFCSVRMVELKVLNKYLTFLHPDIYNCTCIRSYYITEAESRLLNEINMKHCDCQFGREQFTTRDLIVRLSDAYEFQKFLASCYSKLASGDINPADRCGFIRINKESVVPYTIYREQKYVPLFYFEGETDNLKQKADKLEGWDLSYLKFCCKVQGIRNELFAHDSCSVISLNDIKNYFPPGTEFEDYWPKKNMESQLLMSNANRTSQIQWTRQPTAPPIVSQPPASPKPAAQPKAAANVGNMHMYPNFAMGGQPYHSAPRAGTTAIRNSYQAARPQMRPTTFFNTLPQAPPPPPLVPASRPDLQPTYSTPAQNQLINQTPAHQQSSRPLASVSTDNRNNITNGRMNNSIKMNTIPEVNYNGAQTYVPYKVVNRRVEGIPVTCINMKPFEHSELLVPIEDIKANFFDNVPVQSCQQVMRVLGIEIYQPNSTQLNALIESGKCQNANETVSLVQVQNVADFMPQLKYMLGATHLINLNLGSKRTHNS